MAQSRDASRLTDKHRRAQVRLAARVERDIRRLRPDLDVADLDRSWRFRKRVADLVEDGFNKSLDLAAEYMRRFPMVEAGVEEQIVRPVFDRLEVDAQIQTSGIAVAKKKISEGASESQASRAGVNALGAVAAQDVLAGGRGLIDSTVRYSGRAGGYRRVTDGKPCAFCAMLAGRGPVYSQESAYFESHGHCGCTAEPVYHEWEPTELEAQWQESYALAARGADASGKSRIGKGGGRDTILWRMRRNRPDLFHDGVHTKG